MAVAMMSHRGSSTQFSSALVLLLTVVVLDRGSTVVKSLREPDDAMSLKRPMTKRRVARMPGDILIGALFPVHRQPSLKTAYTRQCGEVRSSLKIIILFHFNRVFTVLHIGLSLWLSRLIRFLSHSTCWAYLAGDLQRPGIKSGSRHVGRLD